MAAKPQQIFFYLFLSFLSLIFCLLRSYTPSEVRLSYNLLLIVIYTIISVPPSRGCWLPQQYLFSLVIFFISLSFQSLVCLPFLVRNYSNSNAVISASTVYVPPSDGCRLPQQSSLWRSQRHKEPAMFIDEYSTMLIFWPPSLTTPPPPSLVTTFFCIFFRTLKK